MKRNRKNQADHKADLRGGKFDGVPRALLDSDAYRLGLDVFDRALLMEFIHRFNGYNNGRLTFSQREIAERLNTQNFRRIGKGIARLIETGFLDIATESVWKQRKAREYRLTFVSTGTAGNPVPATNEYLHWKYDAEPVSAANSITAEPVSAGVQTSAEPSSAGYVQEPQKPVEGAKFAAEPVSSLIGKPSVAIESPRSDPIKIPLKTPAAKIGQDLSTLRTWARLAVNELGYGGNRKLAMDAGIAEPSLSRFRSGKSLPETDRLKLQHACARVIRFDDLLRAVA